MKLVTAKLNKAFRKRDYGPGLKEWAFIPIIRAVDSPDYGEVVKYSKRGRDAEFRLKVDHRKFRASSKCAQEKLLFDALVRCVELMPKAGVKDVNVEQLLEDVMEVGRMNGWSK